MSYSLLGTWNVIALAERRTISVRRRRLCHSIFERSVCVCAMCVYVGAGLDENYEIYYSATWFRVQRITFIARTSERRQFSTRSVLG